MQTILLAILAIALGARLSSQATSSSPADVLLEFAAAARGHNLDALDDWHDGTDACTWTGVACSGQAVTALRLPAAGLCGTLAPGLAQLTSLQHIDLAGNELGGSLPARWARLVRLERLSLEGNRLTGTLPADWNMLEGIQYLSLSRNLLGGPLPVAWSSMGRQLYSLELCGNNITGGLPAAWARQSMLFRLGLARNALSGSLPRAWGRLRSLLQLDLAGNALSGGLPAEWGALRQANSLDLAGNRLSGALPEAWAGMASLQMLSLCANQLSGAVPAQWHPLSSRAYSIRLGDNPGLCGKVPPPLAAAILAAGGSNMGTGLAGPCSWQADAAALLQFKAAVRAGPQGAALADWLPEANPCSEESWTGVSCRGGRVVALNLTNAGLAVASLGPLGSLTALQKVLLGGNSATNANLPASWARLEHLTVADLSGMGLSGALPPSWAQLRSARQLLLGGNSLNGTLPASWAALTSLDTLDTSQNALSGGLPAQWGGMAALSMLDASGNYLAGGLPDSWRELASLQQLQLANNNLGGPIPASWAHLPSLTLLNLGSNVGVCGGEPSWRAGTTVHINATNVAQSCILVNTSGAFAGAVLGAALSATLASLVAVGALLVVMRRQRTQLQLLQRERSAASLSSLGDGRGKAAGHHAFSVAGHGAHAGRVKGLTIPNPWGDEADGYIQVPVATPHSSKPAAERATTPRAGSAPPEEHRSPSPVSAMPSPERLQWQVAAQAHVRGVDLTARRARQKQLFRSLSEAPSTLGAAVAATAAIGEDRGGGSRLDWSQDGSVEVELDALRVHSRIALLPPDGGMV